MDPISYLEQRVKDIKHQLQESIDTMNRAKARAELLAADLEGFERVLSAERRINGVIPMTEAPEQPNPQPNTTIDGNKAEFARQLIRKRADIGTLPNDLFKGFQEAGIPITKPCRLCIGYFASAVTECNRASDCRGCNHLGQLRH